MNSALFMIMGAIHHSQSSASPWILASLSLVCAIIAVVAAVITSAYSVNRSRRVRWFLAQFLDLRRVETQKTERLAAEVRARTAQMHRQGVEADELDVLDAIEQEQNRRG